MNKSKITKVALACVVLLIGILSIARQGSNVETYKLEDANETYLKNAKVFYISNGNLYSSPRDGTYRILIEKDVKNSALISNNTLFFIVDSISGGNLASYYYKSCEKRIYNEYSVKDLYLWSSGTGTGVLKEPIPDDFVPFWNHVNIENGCVKKSYVKEGVNDLLSEGKISKIVTLDETSTDGWSIVKKGDSLVFSNGSSSNKISGKKLFLVGAI